MGLEIEETTKTPTISDVVTMIGSVTTAVDKIRKKVDSAIENTQLPDETKDSLKAFSEFSFIAIVLFVMIGSAFGWISLSPEPPYIVMFVTELGILATVLFSVLLLGQIKKRANYMIAGKENTNRQLELENSTIKNSMSIQADKLSEAQSQIKQLLEEITQLKKV